MIKYHKPNSQVRRRRADFWFGVGTLLSSALFAYIITGLITTVVIINMVIQTLKNL